MRRVGGFAKLVVAVVLLAPSLFASGVASATPATYNDANFRLVWERTDKLVQDGIVSRSWMWGPETVPGSQGIEPYVEAPGGNRVVQYFDKSRMEVNDPAGDRSQMWFVTNGLLVREMVSGEVQSGNNAYIKRSPSEEPVAGDPADDNPDAPTYTSFKSLASLSNDQPSAKKSGVVDDFIDKAGAATVGTSPDATVEYAYYDDNLKHNIPNKFWEFMNQAGPVYWYGSTSTDLVVNWVFAMGYPLTEPYWTRAKVAGAEKDILVQLYERRVLTYTPDNPAGFKVEMGNVGQHYKRWIYDTPVKERIAFSSSRSGHMQIWSMETDGSDLKKLTNVGQNMRPSWSPDNSKIAFESHRDGNWEIYVMNANGSDERRLTNDSVSDSSPNWSPNGSRIAFVRGTNIWSMTSDGGELKQLTDTSGFINESPRFSPDGRKIAFMSNRDGNSEIYVMNADGSNQTLLTSRPNTFDAPSDWKRKNILFSSVGQTAGAQIWSIREDGTNSKKVSGDKDTSASYSPDGSKIVLVRNGEVYTMNADASNVTNLTKSKGLDTQPDWSN